MPALVLFGIPLKVAGDDLQPLCIVIILLRLLQLGVLSPVAAFVERELRREFVYSASETIDDCEHFNQSFRTYRAILTTYLYGSFFLIIISIAVELTVMRISSRGTPTQPERRKNIIPLMMFKAVPLTLFIMSVAAIGILSIVYSQDVAYCYDLENGPNITNAIEELATRGTPWFKCLSTLVLSQVIEAGFYVMVSICRANQLVNWVLGGCPSGRPTYDLRESDEWWRNRCHFCCKCSSVFTCFLFGGHRIERGDFGDVGSALTDFFDDGGALDIVGTDTIAGMMALLLCQKNRRVETRKILRAGLSDVARWKAADMESDALILDGYYSPMEFDLNQSCSALLADVEEGREEVGDLENEEEEYRPSRVVIEGCHGTVGGNDLFLDEIDSDDIVAGHEGSDQDDSFHTCHSNLEASIVNIKATIRRRAREESGQQSSSSTDKKSKSKSGRRQTSLMYKIHRDGSSIHYDVQVREILSRDDEADRSVLAEGARFVRHALAIYTWKLYVYERPCSGLCKLGCVKFVDIVKRMAQCCSGSNSSASLSSSSKMFANGKNVVSDNLLGFDKAALMQQAGIEGEVELVYANFREGLEEGPYCIMIDHVWKSVVLTIRGSLSLEDFVIDATFIPDHLESAGLEFGFDGSEEYCHRGLLLRARWIYNDIERTGVLEKLMLGNAAKHKDYRLRVVGHSLGAGCAVLLAFMLRKMYPTLRCLCYSPPGGLLSLKSATNCKDYVITYVLNSDLVPRLSIESMEFLRDEVLTLIARIKVPKYQVTLSYLRRFRGDVVTNVNGTMLHPRDRIPECAFTQQLERFKENQSSRRLERGSLDIHLFPPGRIVHMVRVNERGHSCPLRFLRRATCGIFDSGDKYVPKWAENDDFKEIIVSSNMATDHLPNNVMKALDSICTDYDIDPSHHQ